jgi:hypothetical protein
MGIIMKELLIKGSVVGMEYSRSIRPIDMRGNGKMELFMETVNFLDRESYSLREGLKMD